MKIKTGLFFGSFNPIHIGHMIIANYMIEFTEMDELWFVITPHNPFKKRNTLLADHLRLEMTEIAIGKDERFRACDIEFRMPKPSYTIDTLMLISEKYTGNEFSLIIGSDNLEAFDKWKNYELIEKNFKRYIYPRKNTDNKDYTNLINAEVVNAPQIEISSSFLRESIKNGKRPDKFFPARVFEFIDKMNLYK